MCARRARGFSLIEISFVVILIGILTSVAVVGLNAALSSARLQTTESSLKTLKANISAYSARFGEFPSAIEDMIGVSYDQVPVDAWKTPFYYRQRLQALPGQQPYILASLGPDKTVDTEDDIDAHALDQEGN
ncbi:MAG: type II secretion system protein GspG [Planctomycetota bacterium]